jgi:hypothetical protein
LEINGPVKFIKIKGKDWKTTAADAATTIIGDVV